MFSAIRTFFGLDSNKSQFSIAGEEFPYIWIPDKDTSISIPTYDTKYSKYQIKVQHGDYEWTVYRRYIDFRNLNYALYQGSLIKFVTKFYTKVNNILPGWYDLYWNANNIKIMKMMELYLQNILNDTDLRNHPTTLKFLEVSYLSFNSEFGLCKGIEGLARKKAGGFFGTSGNWLKQFFERWEPCWVVLKDNYLVYLNIEHMKIDGVLLLDDSVQIDKLKRKSMITIANNTRMFQLKFQDPHTMKLWMSHLKGTVHRLRNWIIDPFNLAFAQGCEQINHRFDSYVPPRSNSKASWFIDGNEYFAEVAEALLNAQREIFISDWWLSPQLYLKRPLGQNSDEWRFDNIIKKKAMEGVKIYVLLYKEIPAALGLNSDYSKKLLRSLHPQNVYILRHPNHVKSSVYFWSHHEKVICIDQRVVYLGGLDICYGRWDDNRHRLVDQAPIENELGVKEAFMKSLRSLTSPVNIMEEHYVKVRAGNDGDDEDVKNFKGKLQRFRLLVSGVTAFKKTQTKRSVAEKRLSLYQNFDKVNRMLERSLSVRGAPDGIDLSDVDFIGSGRYWIGKDYSNFIYKDFAEVDKPFTDLIDRQKIPRMPWHDIAAVIFDQPAKDVVRHFIERWNQTLIEKYKQNFPFLLPKNYSNLPELPERCTKNTEPCIIQICRSSANWSAGLKVTENSIENAYIELIKKSKYYVYIENQFFISIHDHPTVRNGIADALYDRIQRAIKNEETYRVYIVMPLLPGFEGVIGENTGTFIETILYWTNLSLKMGPNSLIQRLKSLVDDPFKYISICGLRKYDILEAELVTELIYVHSKLLIVDDEICIIGSANINDRSLLGNRDSEIAAIIEDNQKLVNGVMDNEIVKVGKFVSSLRKHLFREHLMGDSGEKIDVYDPICDDFFNFWNTRAAANTAIYEEVFRCIPTNKVKSLEELKIYQKKENMAQTDGKLAVKKTARNRWKFGSLPVGFLVEDDGTTNSGLKKLTATIACDSPLSILYT